MRKKILLLMLSVVVASKLIYPQQLPTDSVNRVKQQKRIAEITLQINDRKQKLVELEKELVEKTNNKQKAVERAKESADDNRQAAVKLSNDAQDRQKARRAENRSDEARRDAKKA